MWWQRRLFRLLQPTTRRLLHCQATRRGRFSHICRPSQGRNCLYRSRQLWVWSWWCFEYCFDCDLVHSGSQSDHQPLDQLRDHFGYSGDRFDRQLLNANIQLIIIRWLSSRIWNDSHGHCNTDNQLLHHPDSDYVGRIVSLAYMIPFWS